MILIITHRTNEVAIVNGLKTYCGCEVVRANQTGPIPSYPYISYTVITPVTEYNGTYSFDEDSGQYYIAFDQTWSFTVQADDEEVALTTALKAYDWFKLSGLVHLTDNGIVVMRCSDMTNRDNLITIEYEHRLGFDVVFKLNHTVTMTEAEKGGIIETATITGNNNTEVII